MPANSPPLRAKVEQPRFTRKLRFLKANYRRFDEIQWEMESLYLNAPEQFPRVLGVPIDVRMMGIQGMTTGPEDLRIPEAWIWFTFDETTVYLLDLDLPEDPSFLAEDWDEG
ncbi:MAG: hypothetical protein ACHQPI_06090 [Thermoanaerobaculia bacterium]